MSLFQKLPAGLLSMAVMASGGPAQAPGARSPEVWRATMALLPKGDPERGAKLHQSLFCASCHGERGTAPTPNWPHLSGQKPLATVKALLDFQEGRRGDAAPARLMGAAVQGVGLRESADLAAFYAHQPRPSGASGMLAPGLVRNGDPARLITPCASCHGAAGQGGRYEAGALAGQHAAYLAAAMRGFRDGSRTSDLQRSMRQPLARMSDPEIEAIATYYAGLRSAP